MMYLAVLYLGFHSRNSLPGMQGISDRSPYPVLLTNNPQHVEAHFPYPIKYINVFVIFALTIRGQKL